MASAEDSGRIRLFVAVFPPPSVVESVEGVLHRFRRGLSRQAVRWTSPDQIHLTLNFLGAVDRVQVGAFEAALESESIGSCGFHVEAVGTGCFPSVNRPRIIWVGLNGELIVLRTLKERLDSAFQKLGYVPEERGFHPHLTVGRVNYLSGRDGQMITELMEQMEKEQFGQWDVTRVDLMQSVLGPMGSKYTVMSSFPLKVAAVQPKVELRSGS